MHLNAAGVEVCGSQRTGAHSSHSVQELYQLHWLPVRVRNQVSLSATMLSPDDPIGNLMCRLNFISPPNYFFLLTPISLIYDVFCSKNTGKYVRSQSQKLPPLVLYTETYHFKCFCTSCSLL